MDTGLFFDKRPEALPIYKALEDKILADIQNVEIKAQKTQITFANGQIFAYVSFLPARKTEWRPKVYITITFVLGYKKESPRVDAAIELYPNRWTHHVVATSMDEIDDELLGWIKEAGDFSAKGP